MRLVDLLVTPFADYAFMRRALVAGLTLSCGAAPLGVFLFHRRMSLMGDALQHAILPGVALAYFLYGLSLWAMTVGGLLAGLLVAVFSGAIARVSKSREEGSFAALYLIAMAFGVLLMTLRRSPVDVMHLLFGNILAVTGDVLWLLVLVAGVTMVLLAVFYRALVCEAVDPVFLAATSGKNALYHMLFVGLAVLNLVAGFQAMGALMALGVIILPAAAASFWSRESDGVIGLAFLFAVSGIYVGLLLSFHADWASGPAIVLSCGAFYLLSMLFGRFNSVRMRYFPPTHLTH